MLRIVMFTRGVAMGAAAAGRHPATRRRAACPRGAESVWRPASGGRAAGRRHRRLAAGKTVGILSRNVVDDPGRQVGRLGGLDLARDFLCLRDISMPPAPATARRSSRPTSSPTSETARRGIVLSFASAMLQALVAVVVLVGICAWLCSTPRRRQCAGRRRAIEIASYALIAIVRRPAGLDQGRRLSCARYADEAGNGACARHGDGHGARSWSRARSSRRPGP